MEYLDGKIESILFEPYLIGENPIGSWTFIFGKSVEKNSLATLAVPFIVSVEETGNSFEVAEKDKTFLICDNVKNKIIKCIPDIEIVDISEPEVEIGDLNDFFIDVPELYSRGWTESLINKFLGSAHFIKSVDHWLNYSGKRTYFLGCVEKIEKTEVFNNAYTKSFKRRNFTADENCTFSMAREKTAGKVKSLLAKSSKKEIQDWFDKFKFFTSTVFGCVYDVHASPYKHFWFSVTMDLKTKRINEITDRKEKFLYWVKKTYAPKDDLCWYNYELYDSEIKPTQLKEGSFTCVKIYEIVPKDGGDNYWFGFEIVDANNVTCKKGLMCKGEKGIIEVIKMMRKAANYENWATYDDALKKLGIDGDGRNIR
ncbi:MAG: hypothetical protein NTU98_08065 [Bacteroidetes bacterium]|nr:hypothetical protein [Bacteroidota bacterium]